MQQIEQGQRVMKLFNCDCALDELGMKQHVCLFPAPPTKAELKAEVERATRPTVIERTSDHDHHYRPPRLKIDFQAFTL